MATTNVKVSTDEKLIDKFLNRGVEKLYPGREKLEDKLKSGVRLTAYMGFDPTGPYLHVGHAMGIRALRILQQLGHRVIFLVGDYTARVGDPDKDSTRELLTPEKIKENMSGWKEQAGQIIDFEDSKNPVEFAHNFDWLSKLNLEELIKLMSNMTVQQMLERDLFAKRLDKNNPIQLQEFIYPLMQGYDSVAMEVDIELGGADQTFNMLVGRDLVKNYLGKEKFVRTHQMMPAPNGITMSKTKGNGINLADNPEDMYGKAMSYADEHIVQALELLTDVEMSEIEVIEKSIAAGENPMPHKKFLAKQIVAELKGEAAATKAEQYFEDTVQNKDASQAQTTKISLEKMQNSLRPKGKDTDSITILAELNESSKGDIKRLLKQGGIKLNDQKLQPADKQLQLKPGDIVQIGKRNYFEIV